ncbi:hypothetical protein F5879DRAFT_376042 [Lentinula edodes]|nr:hypothetical protein F5879DRAFT_376042 [Lentinula edodes]
MKTPFILETRPLVLCSTGAFWVHSWSKYISTLFGIITLIREPSAILAQKGFCQMTTMNDIVSIVYVLFVVEGVQTGLMTYTAWEILAYNWGDPSILLNISWSSATTPITGGIGTCLHFFHLYLWSS